MQIDYELQQADFIESFAAHRQRNVFSKWLIRAFLAFAILMAGFMVLGLIVLHDVRDTKNLMPLFTLTLLWVGILWALPRWSARRQFLKQPGAQGPRSVVFDDSGAHWRWNGGSSDIAWKNYVRFVEGTKQFLLYTSPACFNIIPKRALSPEAILELRSQLKQNISQ